MIKAGGHFGMQSDLIQLVLVKTPTQMLSPLLWFRKVTPKQTKSTWHGLVRGLREKHGLFSASEDGLFLVDGEN